MVINEIPDDLPEGHGQTWEQFRFSQALESVYLEQPTESDYELSVIERSGGDQTVEPADVDFDRVVPTAKVLSSEYGRFDAVRFLYHYWSNDETPTHEDFDTQEALAGIELLELAKLRLTGREHSGIIRACSFFQFHFKTEINSDSTMSNIDADEDLNDTIVAARKRNIITEEQECLYHFIRKVRNECAHNAWVTSDIPIGMLYSACQCGEYLLVKLINSKQGVSSGDWFMGTSTSELLRIIEEEWGWNLDQSDGNVSWTPPDEYDNYRKT